MRAVPANAGRGAAPRERRRIEQRQRLCRALLLQQVSNKIESHLGRGRIARESVTQQFLARLRLAGQPQKGAEIGGSGTMTGSRARARRIADFAS